MNMKPWKYVCTNEVLE